MVTNIRVKNKKKEQMKTIAKTDASQPCAWISVDGGRKKIYDDKFVYLKDGQSFEIELNNPTSTTYLAKIKLNGKDTSTSGFVVRPGERYTVKRYLDSDNAYVFRTYEVEANNEAVDKAIEKNGLLTVEFYAEYTPINYAPYSNPIWIYNGPYYGGYYNYLNGNVGTTVTLNSSSGSNTTTLANTNYNVSYTSYSDQNSKSLSDGDFTFDFNDAAKKETGTVEMGDATGQNFRTVNKQFNSWTSYTSEYQILPESLMPIVKEDIKIYCSNCGKKCKHKDNFCPKCGTKLMKG